jgi:hypothetical protein
MGLFRRRREETLNEILLHEAGLDAPAQRAAPSPEPFEPLAVREATASFPLAPLPSRAWDVVTTCEAPNVQGDSVEFVALADGSLVVDEEQGDADLGPFADAVEAQLAPPYRAKGTRQSGSNWSVGANPVAIAQFEAAGDVIELTRLGETRTQTVDGAPTSGSFPELERLGEREAADYAVHAERLDGDFWEVRAAAL